MTTNLQENKSSFKAHVINDGIVVNTIEVDSLDFMQGLVLATEGAIGWSYDGIKFTPPIEEKQVPPEITMRQCRLQLLKAGLLSDVNSAMASIQDEVERQAATIEWEYSASVQRASSWVGALGAALGLTTEELDDLFIEAALL